MHYHKPSTENKRQLIRATFKKKYTRNKFCSNKWHFEYYNEKLYAKFTYGCLEVQCGYWQAKANNVLYNTC